MFADASLNAMAIDSTTFVANVAQTSGGALYSNTGNTLALTAGAPVAFLANRVQGTAPGQHGTGVGGAVALIATPLSIGACAVSFVNNTAPLGSGMYLDSLSTVTLTNSSSPIRFVSMRVEHLLDMTPNMLDEYPTLNLPLPPSHTILSHNPLFHTPLSPSHQFHQQRVQGSRRHRLLGGRPLLHPRGVLWRPGRVVHCTPPLRPPPAQLPPPRVVLPKHRTPQFRPRHAADDAATGQHGAAQSNCLQRPPLPQVLVIDH